MAFLVGLVFPPPLSDSECLTVELVGQYLGYTSQKQLYEQMHDRWSTWFPALKDRVAFGRQCATSGRSKLGCIPISLSGWAVIRLPAKSLIRYPVPICHTARRFQRRIFRTESVGAFPAPTLGYCAAKDERLLWL